MKVFVRLLELTAPFRWWMIAAVLLSFATVGSSVGLMAFSSYLIAKAALAVNPSELYLAIAGVRLFALSRAIFRYIERIISHTASFRILAHLRTWFYHAIEPLAPACLQQVRSGDLLSRIMSDIETLEQFFIRAIVPPLSAALVTLLATMLLGSFHPSLGLALLVFLLLTGLVLPIVSRLLSSQPAAMLIHLRSELNASILDGIQGIPDLIAFDRSKKHQDQVDILSQQVNRYQEQLALIQGMSHGLAALFTSLAGIMVLWLAIPLVTGELIGGVYLALLPLVAIASFEAVQPLSQSLEVLESSKVAAERLFEMINASPPVSDSPGESPPNNNTSIRFKNVSFRYESTEPLVLNKLTFSIEQGQHLAITGPSGSGKSTIVNLLLRFWDYQNGRIELGDHELRCYHAADVRRLISVITQHTHIFNSTIRDNLYLANASATDEDLLRACQIAQLDNFIAQLPSGLDTPTGENGLLLSGGERQRLAIARAILKNAPILILDEATANLDAGTEQLVWYSLEKVMHGRTTLIISHRTNILPKVDCIVELQPTTGYCQNSQFTDRKWPKVSTQAR